MSYDTDGNLKALGSRTFIYNAENQLIEVKNSSTTLATFKYDYLGRRVGKVTSGTERYFYDGWNLVAVYDANTGNKKPLITYTWGLDLSNTLQGAGGVGGLLMSCQPTGTGWTYYHDGHGNVVQVMPQSGGATPSVAVEYDPYGNIIAGAPSWTLANAFRFSLKFFDAETGLHYYGYRYYDSVHGRWSSRDPIGEQAFIESMGRAVNDGVLYSGLPENLPDELTFQDETVNLYVACKNNTVDHWDYLGLIINPDCTRDASSICLKLSHKIQRMPGVSHVRFQACLKARCFCICKYPSDNCLGIPGICKGPTCLRHGTKMAPVIVSKTDAMPAKCKSFVRL